MRAFRKFYVSCVLRADRMAVTADVLLSKEVPVSAGIVCVCGFLCSSMR